MNRNQYELYHYGVKGMKWGVRKKPEYTGQASGAYDRMVAAKQAKKSANKAYNKAFNKSSSLYGAYGPGSKKRLNDTTAKAKAANKANAEYKKAKTDFKKATVKEYEKVGKQLDKISDRAYESDRAMKDAYKALGKNRVSRIINAAKGTSPEAKAYNKAADKALRDQEVYEKKYDEFKKTYRNTGRNYADRIFNNIRYGH